MRRRSPALILTVLVVLLAVFLALWGASAEKRIAVADLNDKIAGGWAGQMIGVSYGAPTEFRAKSVILEEKDIPGWKPDRVSNSLGQDDLYVDMTFAKVLDDKGLDATTEDFGAMFRDAKYSLWHANLAARRALKRGVPATLSGTPKYNAHANDIDFQIEADFIGMMTPGLPQAATAIAGRAGRVMNYGDGIYGGMFVSCMYASAFFEKDPRKIVEAGLACVPRQSPYALLLTDLLAWSKEQPTDWIAVWTRLDAKWNKREPCPSGALKPFNIDAKLNGAYIALGLIYGRGDMERTLNISTRCGQDSDCNPSSAAGILGVVLGYKGIPDIWKSGIPTIADSQFRYTDFSFKTIVASTEKRAVAMVMRNGGRMEGDTLVVKTQSAKPPKLEVWDDYGSPVERIPVDDKRWTWSQGWDAPGGGPKREAARGTAQKGAEFSVTFQGTGAILVGPYLASGGKADIYLDGKLHSTVDAFSDESGSKGEEAVWHAFKLPDRPHVLRLVVRGEPFPGSKGSDIGIQDLVVFR
jgi:hypothetical protein